MSANVTITTHPWNEEWDTWKRKIERWNGVFTKRTELLPSEKERRKCHMDGVMKAILHDCQDIDADLTDPAYVRRVRHFFYEAWFGDFSITAD